MLSMLKKAQKACCLLIWWRFLVWIFLYFFVCGCVSYNMLTQRLWILLKSAAKSEGDPLRRPHCSVPVALHYLRKKDPLLSAKVFLRLCTSNELFCPCCSVFTWLTGVTRASVLSVLLCYTLVNLCIPCFCFILASLLYPGKLVYPVLRFVLASLLYPVN